MISYAWGPDHEWGGVYYPLIICDACLKPISDGHGNAYWLVRENGEIHPQIWHTHKLHCAELDRTLEKRHGGMVLFEELSTWLGQLQHNLTHPVRQR